jgi:hypothetical protein
LYAGAAVTVTAGGSALTYVGGAALAGTTPLLLTPLGWFVLGAVLLSGSFALQWAGESAKDTDIEKWLDAGTFGKRRDAPVYDTLEEEMTALGYALHAPKAIDTDWSTLYTFNNYQAEAKVYLPGYDNLTSHLSITANGHTVMPAEQEHQGGGSILTLRYYVRKSERIGSVTFDIRYRPSPAFEKDFKLSITVSDNIQHDEPTIPGP